MASRRWWVRTALIASAILAAADLVYKTVGHISVANRDQCLLLRALPGPWRLVFEYVIETGIVVFLGAFAAVLVARGFSRWGRFFPHNPITAFVAASLVPICACAAVPLLCSMRGKGSFPTILSFVLAAPLLSPTILVLSFTVLGFTYGVLRIVSSFALVMACVFAMGLVRSRVSPAGLARAVSGCDRSCSASPGDPYLETWSLFRRLLPLLLLTGAAGVLLEQAGPRTFLLRHGAMDGIPGVLLWVLVGVPLYFCNGAEVLFLRPLMNHGFPVGTAVAFSLTSTAVCATSAGMLVRTLGSRLTLTFVLCVVSVSTALALAWNGVFGG